MELPMYSLSSLKVMEVIDLSTGSKMGYIKDLKVDCSNYKVVGIVLPSKKSTFFSKANDIEIPWEKVVKIGVDTIIINGEGFTDNII